MKGKINEGIDSIHLSLSILASELRDKRIHTSPLNITYKCRVNELPDAALSRWKKRSNIDKKERYKTYSRREGI